MTVTVTVLRVPDAGEQVGDVRQGHPGPASCPRQPRHVHAVPALRRRQGRQPGDGRVLLAGDTEVQGEGRGGRGREAEGGGGRRREVWGSERKDPGGVQGVGRVPGGAGCRLSTASLVVWSQSSALSHCRRYKFAR